MQNKIAMACCTEITISLISVPFPVEKYVCHKKTPLQFSLIHAFVGSYWRLNRPRMDLDVLPRPALKWIKTVETVTFSSIYAFGLLFCPPTHCGLHCLSKISYAKLFFSMTSTWDYVYVESEMGSQGSHCFQALRHNVLCKKPRKYYHLLPAEDGTSSA